MANVYRILKSTLDDIADAIRAKTGGSAAMTPAQMVAAIGNIPTGGSLPSVISKIDGGSFTLTSDTVCSAYNIPTTLNSPAARFLIWTEDLNLFEAVSKKALIQAVVDFQRIETSSSSAVRYGFYSYTQRNTNGSSYNGLSGMAYSNQPSRFTGNDWINYFISDTYYLAGVTYKWLAWV